MSKQGKAPGRKRGFLGGGHSAGRISNHAASTGTLRCLPATQTLGWGSGGTTCAPRQFGCLAQGDHEAVA